MLTDRDRKLLRVLYNFTSMWRRSPTYDELKPMTGQFSRKDLEASLRTLQVERYISWDGRDPSTVKVLERQDPPKTKMWGER